MGVLSASGFRPDEANSIEGLKDVAKFPPEKAHSSCDSLPPEVKTPPWMSTVPETAKTQLCSTHLAFLLKARGLKQDEKEVWFREPTGDAKGFRNGRR